MGRWFGLVCVDEAHHVPARTWGELLSDLAGAYRLAVTATPERLDDRTGLLYAHCGSLVHEIELSDLESIGAVLAPEVMRLARPNPMS